MRGAGGRPPKPIEQKKLEGTYRKDRDLQREQTEKQLREAPSAMFKPGEKVKCPASITDRYVRNYWKKMTTALIALGVLSYVDVPEVEQLCMTLQKLREVQVTFSTLSPFDEDFDLWEKRYIRLANKFSELGAKYFISPAARSKLRLEDLNIQKTEKELEKASSPLDDILKRR